MAKCPDNHHTLMTSPFCGDCGAQIVEAQEPVPDALREAGRQRATVIRPEHELG
jgi:hypothetical protein